MSVEADINSLIKEYLTLCIKTTEEGFLYKRLSPTRDLGEKLDPHNFSTSSSADYTQTIDRWIWNGEPTSLQISDYERCAALSIEYALKIDDLICKANAMECMSSPSEYVREFKKWQHKMRLE